MEARDHMAQHATLRSLFDHVAGDSQVVAVTTWGETKSKLRPQVCERGVGGWV